MKYYSFFDLFSCVDFSNFFLKLGELILKVVVLKNVKGFPLR